MSWTEYVQDESTVILLKVIPTTGVAERKTCARLSIAQFAAILEAGNLKHERLGYLALKDDET